MIKIHTSKPRIDVETPIKLEDLKKEIDDEYKLLTGKEIDFERSTFILSSIKLKTGVGNNMTLDINVPLDINLGKNFLGGPFDFDADIHAIIREKEEEKTGLGALFDDEEDKEVV